MSLKPQDVVVGLYLSLQPEGKSSYGVLQSALKLSLGELHKSIQRLKQAGLFGNSINRAALEEFLIHGVKYAFAAQRGARTRGLLTGADAPPLKALLSNPTREPLVWPHPLGTSWGEGFEPLYRIVPQIALENQEIYEMFALVDAIRGGGARERRLAEELLRERLRTS